MFSLLFFHNERLLSVQFDDVYLQEAFKVGMKETFLNHHLAFT